MANKLYWSKTALTGGAATALDYIDGDDDGNTDHHALTDGDVAHVLVGGILYVYRLDATSGAAESSPTIIAPDTNAGNKRWILQESRSIAVGSDADGDMYYRAASVLARLAKGTANTKMFMNAGATAPEWASGIKLGTFTRAMDGTSGDVAYTAVGFKPSAIIFIVGHTTSVGWGSIGFSDGTLNYCQFSNSVASTGTQTIDTSKAILLLNTGSQVAIVKTMDADGFTLTWSLSGNAGTSTATGIYIALR